MSVNKIGLAELCRPPAVARAVAKVARAQHRPGPDGIRGRHLLAVWSRDGERILAALRNGTYDPGQVRARERNSEDQPVTFDQNQHARVISTLLLEGLYRAYTPFIPANVLGFWRGQNTVTRVKAGREFADSLGASAHVAIVTFDDFLELEVGHDRLLTALAMRFRRNVVRVIGSLLAAPVEGEPSWTTGSGLRRGESLTAALTNVVMLGAGDRWAASIGRPWLRYQAGYHLGFEQEADARKFARQPLELGDFCQVLPRSLPINGWRHQAPRLLHLPAGLWHRPQETL